MWCSCASECLYKRKTQTYKLRVSKTDCEIFLEKEIIFTEYDKKCVHTSQKTLICMISSFRHPDINIKVTVLVLMVTISLYNYKRC